MAVSFTQVDAFTDRRFAGNPAAVCLLTGPQSDEWMQAVAREMNLSETAFLVRQGGDFGLRWFTPTSEVELCGHATLASAHMLWESGELDFADAARFHTRSGLLTARRHGEWIDMDFPATPATQADAPAKLFEALDVRPRWIGKSRFDYLVEVESEEMVRNLQPDFRVLREIPIRGIIVTAPGSGAYDFVSRFFASASGIDEDPVTGSAHCCLGPYWRERLGREVFTAYQASPRGGEVRVGVAGERVVLGGKAVTVLRGEIL